MLIDTHCHIHERDFPLDLDSVLAASSAANVKTIICVGTSMQSSRDAIDFSKKYFDDSIKIFAILGVHPHETANFSLKSLEELEKLIPENHKVVKGIGEIGLDYFYEFAPRATQQKACEMQLQLATDFNLPISFHVRDDRENSGAAWRDFWAILNNFSRSKIRGVLHSYTEQNRDNLEKGLAQDFYFGVNGIATFAKPNEQSLWRDIPLTRMVLETDAPFLAPVPFRGRANQPSYIPQIAQFLANLKNETFVNVAKITTASAEKLFQIW